MSRIGRIGIGLVILATMILEVVVYLTYKNSVDGQAIFLNFFVAVYGLLAILMVAIVDLIVRFLKRRIGASRRPSTES